MRRQPDLFKKQQLCIGRQPVLEALQAGKDLERIYIVKGLSGDAVKKIEAQASTSGIPLNFVPKEKLGRLTNLNHQGIVAILSEIRYYALSDIVDQCFVEGRDPLIVLLDGITDVGNFGAICRTALGMKADAVVIGHYHSASVNEQAIKASAGAIHHLHICREKNIGDSLAYLNLSGFMIIGMDGNAEHLIAGTEIKGPVALVMGSEEKGIHGSIREHITHMVRLPMDKVLESYNVSVAAAMALYEINRQRS